MLTIIIRTLKDRLTTTLAFCAASVVFLWMYIALFPYIQGQAATLSKLIDTYPKGFLQAFGITSLEEQFGHLGSYLATEMFSLIFPVMVVALVVGSGASALAGEIERGTIELLMSQPISRLELYVAKYLAAIKILGAFVLVSVMAIAPLAGLYLAEFAWASLARFSLMAFLFGLAILSFSFFASSLFSDKSKASFLVTGLIVLMYVINIISALKPSLADLKYGSFFHYYDPAATLGRGALLDAQAVGVLLGVSFIATLLGAWRFIKRDL